MERIYNKRFEREREVCKDLIRDRLAWKSIS